MSHMASSNGLDELHEMASKLDVNRRHFQNKPQRPHYDICRSNKKKAIRLGAIEVDDRTLVKECFLKEEEPEMVTVCAECLCPTEESTYGCGSGWDGNTICSGCGMIEPDTIEVPENEISN